MILARSVPLCRQGHGCLKEQQVSQREIEQRCGRNEPFQKIGEGTGFSWMLWLQTALCHQFFKKTPVSL